MPLYSTGPDTRQRLGCALRRVSRQRDKRGEIPLWPACQQREIQIASYLTAPVEAIFSGTPIIDGMLPRLTRQRAAERELSEKQLDQPSLAAPNMF